MRAQPLLGLGMRKVRARFTTKQYAAVKGRPCECAHRPFPIFGVEDRLCDALLGVIEGVPIADIAKQKGVQPRTITSYVSIAAKPYGVSVPELLIAIVHLYGGCAFAHLVGAETHDRLMRWRQSLFAASKQQLITSESAMWPLLVAAGRRENLALGSEALAGLIGVSTATATRFSRAVRAQLDPPTYTTNMMRVLVALAAMYEREEGRWWPPSQTRLFAGPFPTSIPRSGPR